LEKGILLFYIVQALNKRSLIRNSFKLCCGGCSLLYLLCCLLPWLFSGNWWFIAMLGLVFPFLAILLLLALIILAIKKSRLFFLVLLILAAGWQQLSAIVGLNMKSTVSAAESGGPVIRILTWNVSRWDERNKEKRGGLSFRPLMLDFIKMQEADILCFQEFFESNSPQFGQATIPAIKAMGYKYHFFYPSSQMFEGTLQFGLCIFSKFPILDSGAFNPYKSARSEGLAFIDVLVNSQKIRVYTTHLESPGLTKDDYNEDGTAKASRSVISKIKNSYSIRNLQASFVRSQIDQSPYPVIVTGDFNDVPNSYAYFTIRKNLSDVFLDQGNGFGRTLRFISPTLRIDYIFTDSKIKSISFASEKIPYSDHFPLVAELKIISRR
jgi:endonuclease/exonuclease/phosphatase family metal-dependent hydrolase